jgi:hypothetical protein
MADSYVISFPLSSLRVAGIGERRIPRQLLGALQFFLRFRVAAVPETRVGFCFVIGCRGVRSLETLLKITS